MSRPLQYLSTVEPPIKDTIEITSEQRTRFNVPNGDFNSYSSNIILTSDKGQPLNKGQNGQKTMGPKRVEVPLFSCTLPHKALDLLQHKILDHA